jgi:nucleotide-binding universal stress UspA family protein
MLVQAIQPVQGLAFKDLLVPVLRTADDEGAISVADQFAALTGGRFTAILAQPMPGEYAAADVFSGGELLSVMLSELRKENEKEAARLKQRLAQAASTVEFRATPLDFVLTQETVVMSARHADLTILQQPGGDAYQGVRNDLVEAVLLQSGRPVLIVPPAYRKALAFKRIVIGWKPTREAARAVGDAASLIDAAEAVTIVTVDAHDTPGVDLATHLAHRGAKAEVRNEVSRGRTDARTLLDVAAEVDADLIVIGGYGHSRMRELVLGGVTRELLRAADRPLFMSH